MRRLRPEHLIVGRLTVRCPACGADVQMVLVGTVERTKNCPDCQAAIRVTVTMQTPESPRSELYDRAS